MLWGSKLTYSYRGDRSCEREGREAGVCVCVCVARVDGWLAGW